ncbi:MAG: metallophosphoesterase [Nitrospirae bacterium]|nr:metallophosphoesterase [Nitrospirota bacterium]
MRLFIFFISAYGLANLYIFFKLSYLFKAGTTAGIVTGLCILFMALSPVLIHFYSMRGNEKTARTFAYTGFMWVSLLIVFFPLALLLEFYNFIMLRGDVLFGRDLSSIAVSPFYTFFAPLCISAAVNVYGIYEAKNLKVEKLTVKTSKLPEGVGKITIAQISDLHLGMVIRDKALNKVIRLIEGVKPDLIVSTGDLLDGVVSHVDYLSDNLKKLHARLGKFAVIGNHEFYGGLKHSIKFIETSGFTILRGRGITVEGIINIAGVDDLNGDTNKDHNGPEKEILSKLPDNIFTLLLKHRPEIDSGSFGLFDLQLSGHTHNGQIFPINLLAPFIFEHHTGFINLSKGSALYVSRGAGTAGPPVRFLSPPELTIIEVVSEQKAT